VALPWLLVVGNEQQAEAGQRQPSNGHRDRQAGTHTTRTQQRNTQDKDSGSEGMGGNRTGSTYVSWQGRDPTAPLPPAASHGLFGLLLSDSQQTTHSPHSFAMTGWMAAAPDDETDLPATFAHSSTVDAPALAPTWAQKLACLSAGLLLGLVLLAVAHIVQVQTLHDQSPAHSAQLQPLSAAQVPVIPEAAATRDAVASAKATTSHALAVTSNDRASSNTARRLLADAPPGVRHGRQRRPRHQHAQAGPDAGKTSAELLEADVLAAGGRPLAEDSIPCAFSFHPDAKTALAVTGDTSGNWVTPTSPMFNLLEWFYGVVLSFEAGVQYAYLTPYALDKPTAQVWPRFWGLAAGEFTPDDLSQRQPEAKLAEVFVDNALDIAASVSKIEAATKALGEGINKDNAPPTLWHLRRPRVLDSHMVCHPKVVRVLRQKYCAARAFRPVPVSLYEDASAHADAAASLASDSGPSLVPDMPLLPPAQQHPIHIAVQLHSLLDSPAGPSAEASADIFKHLPASMEEYVTSMGLLLTQLLTSLRRHSTAQLHVHLFADPPLVQTDSTNALWALESHPGLRSFIRGDASANPSNEGVSLQSHYFLSALHSFHHLVMSDVLVTGWSSSSLMAVALHEGGAILVPSLPRVVELGGQQPSHFDLPLCGEWMESYDLRLKSASEDPSDKKRVEKQRVKIEKWLNAEGAEVPPATPIGGNGASAAAPAQTPFRLPLPSRRLARRRSAEALVLSTAFSNEEPLVRPPLFRPNALLMRHCQAIPEPTFRPRPAFVPEGQEENDAASSTAAAAPAATEAKKLL
jgi:hypothetical protein